MAESAFALQPEDVQKCAEIALLARLDGSRNQRKIRKRTSMTREEAIRNLAPETTAEALAEIEYYAGFRGEEAVRKAVDDACVLAVAALQEQQEQERGCEYCNNYSAICGRDEGIRVRGNILRIDIGCPRQIYFCPMCGRRLHLAKPTPQKSNS